MKMMTFYQEILTFVFFQEIDKIDCFTGRKTGRNLHSKTSIWQVISTILLSSTIVSQKKYDPELYDPEYIDPE